MIYKDKVFLEGTSLISICQEYADVEFVGHWNVSILAPKLSAANLLSITYAFVVWLESVKKATLHSITINESPDDLWSIALEEDVCSI